MNALWFEQPSALVVDGIERCVDCERPLLGQEDRWCDDCLTRKATHLAWAYAELDAMNGKDAEVFDDHMLEVEEERQELEEQLGPRANKFFTEVALMAVEY